MNRRHFMKTAAAAGVTAAMPGLALTGCTGIKREDTHMNITDFASVPVNSLDRTGRQILYYASLAPSTHNTQPWKVKITGRRQWVICADTSRQLTVVDPDAEELMLSLGAFAENLAAAARSFGYTAEMAVTARTPSDEEVIRVNLRKNRSTSSDRLKAIRNRMTVKQGLGDREISPAHIRALQKLANGGLYYFPRETQHADCIKEGTVENFRIQSNRSAAQAELSRWIRLSAKTAKRHMDGLTTESMGITGIPGWILRTFYKPADFTTPGFIEKGIEKTAAQVEQGGGWIVITSADHSVRSLVETGMKFERAALAAREMGIGLHPMSQYLEEEKGKREIARHHSATLIPRFVIRTGYVDRYPSPVSLRRPVADFVTGAS